MARDERNPLVRGQLYQLLGGVRDEALARRALELALTDEPGATNSSQIIGAVAGGPSRSRLRFRARAIASGSSRWSMPRRARATSPALGARLGRSGDDRQARRTMPSSHMTPQSRAPADRAIASIRDRVRVREQRLPEISRWLEARRG